MKGKLIVLFFLLNCCAINSWSQQHVFKGRVIDNNNQPVEFATVLLKNFDRVTYTDSIGQFSFTIPNKFNGTSLDLKIAQVGKKTIEPTISILELKQLIVFKLTDLSLELSEVEINQVRKIQNSNSSIVFDRQALEQSQAFSLTDILNNLPGKKIAPPALQSPQNITLRTEATGIQAMNNSFGVAIIIDDIQLSNNANMQNRNVGKWGVGGSTISSARYGSFDVPFSGLDIRDIPIDNIESIEVISGVAPAKYGDLTAGAVILNRQAGKTPFQFATRINGASTNASLSKGFQINKKWGAINYNVNYLRSNDDPSDKTKIYDRVSGGAMWTSYLFHNTKNTLSFDFGNRIDHARLDPDDGFEIMTFAKSRNFSISDRLAINLNGSVAKSINMSVSYSNSYSESYNQRYLNTTPKGITDKDTTGYYEGYFIPGNFLSVEHIKGNPINVNGNISLSNEVYTGKLLHNITIGGNIYAAQNNGRGVIVDPSKPRWANTAYQNDRPYDYESLPNIFNYGMFLQDNFKLNIYDRYLSINAGLRHDVQNAQATLQPRVNISYALSKEVDITAAYGLSTKGPSLAHRYPAPSFIDLIVVNSGNGNVNESTLLVYTDKFIQNNTNLKSSRSNQVELGLRVNKPMFSTSIFGYYKTDKDGFSDITAYRTYAIPEFVVTPIPGSKPILTPKGTYSNRYVGVHTIGNDLNSKNIGLEWSISSKKIKAIETSINLNNSFSYSYYKNNSNRTIPVSQLYIDQGKKPWFGIYPPNEFIDWNFMTKISTTTHIPELGFVVNLLSDISWQNIRKNLSNNRIPFAYLDRNLVRTDIPVFDSNNDEYNFLALTSGQESRTILPFPVANLSARISKEIKKKMTLSVNAYNIFNVKTRYYNPATNTLTIYSTPTSVGAELSIKF
ncbi:MAG: TonB-dependent receptor [Pedobacter sp.]|nr:MAG: TonB-dependent receptor [Pedobacter sp.]